MATKIEYIPISSNQTVPLYESSRGYAILTVLKETSGDVTIGTRKPLSATSGYGLLSEVPTTFLIAPGSTVFAYAASSEAVSIIVQPLDWMSSILAAIIAMGKAFSKC